MKKTGFYIILKINFLMIPLSSRIEKYKAIVADKKAKGKPCDIIHIVKLDDDRESAFLIQDMFPITEEYILREYTIAGNHLMLTSEHTANTVEQKAKSNGNVEKGSKVHTHAARSNSDFNEIKPKI